MHSSDDAAGTDDQAVEDLDDGTDPIDTFDAAVIGKKDDGKVELHKQHEQPTRRGGWVGAG